MNQQLALTIRCMPQARCFCSAGEGFLPSRNKFRCLLDYSGSGFIGEEEGVRFECHFYLTLVKRTKRNLDSKVELGQFTRGNREPESKFTSDPPTHTHMSSLGRWLGNDDISVVKIVS